MWNAWLVVLTTLLLLIGFLWMNSPGRPRPFLDAAGRPLAGSIAEKVRVPINGVEQGVFIKGQDVIRICSSESEHLRPPTRPRERAALRPAMVRSRMRSRSNSANAEKIWN